MQSIYYYFLALTITAASAREFSVDEPNNPVKEVHTGFGVFNHEHVTYLRAVIRPNHLTNKNRVEFPASTNDYFVEAMAPGDQRGHVLAAQFSGPPKWYNLTPQNARVNRNAGFQSLATDWYGTECEVRRFLNKGGNRSVWWEVTMRYLGNSNRPDTYFLQVGFYRGSIRESGIETAIRNPFRSQDSSSWICLSCGINRQENDELREKGEGCTQA